MTAATARPLSAPAPGRPPTIDPGGALPVAADGGRSFTAGLWRLADPKISLASFAGLFLAASLAARDGPLAWDWLALTVLGVFCLEVAKNASGEVFDYDSGADLAVGPEDRSPFSGGKRVLVDAVLTRRQTWGIAAAGYACAAAIGLLIVFRREPAVLWLGLLGMAGAWFYQAPPLRLSYRGLGELAVAVCYGPLVVSGAYLVQRGALPWPVVAASLPLGVMIAAFLLINEFPDHAADRSAGKRTLVVALGRRRAARGFAALVPAAALLTAAAVLAGAPIGLALGGVGLIPAAWATRDLIAHGDRTARIVSAQARTLLGFVLFAVGAGVGAHWL
ncbi:MAG TPA: prenyltransferase [Chloroflexota bacterium]|nr:prenyltransferase [Chloroflexota bacterium]